MSAHLLEGHLKLPAHHKPTQDLLRISVEVCAQEGLGFEPSLGSRIRTQRTGTAGKPVEYHTAVFEAISTMRSPLPYQLAILVGFQTVFVSWATSERLGSRSPLRRGLPIWTGASWRSRFVEGGIQTQAADEGDRIGELAAALEQFERCVSAIGYGHDLALGV